MAGIWLFVASLLIPIGFAGTALAAIASLSGMSRLLSIALVVLVVVFIASLPAIWDHPVDVYRGAIVACVVGLLGHVLLWVTHARLGSTARVV
ncbi:MAG: hypothetical protein KDE27_32920 [Planctomycetes bacterium]|nr:hypothetical protein [Planctomycetota bacterium]